MLSSVLSIWHSIDFLLSFFLCRLINRRSTWKSSAILSFIQFGNESKQNRQQQQQKTKRNGEKRKIELQKYVNVSQWDSEMRDWKQRQKGATIGIRLRSVDGNKCFYRIKIVSALFSILSRIRFYVSFFVVVIVSFSLFGNARNFSFTYLRQFILCVTFCPFVVNDLFFIMMLSVFILFFICRYCRQSSHSIDTNGSVVVNDNSFCRYFFPSDSRTHHELHFLSFLSISPRGRNFLFSIIFHSKKACVFRWIAFTLLVYPSSIWKWFVSVWVYWT